jgi:O-antigen/teichoic acid export membrane protein
MVGFVTAYFAYDYSARESVILGIMSFVLLLILIVSFRSKTEPTHEPNAPLAIAAELDDFGTGKKVLGAIIACVFLFISAYLSIGLFAGIVLFVAQVVVLYIMKWIYGTDDDERAPAST